MTEGLNIAQYLDSTYLTTSKETDCTEKEEMFIVKNKIKEAISCQFACIMIRPIFVKMAKDIIEQASGSLKIGTVIDFPLGNSSTKQKLVEAKKAMEDGAFDIDIVCDYNAFKRGSLDKFNLDIIKLTGLVLSKNRIVKWIIETGALSAEEIIGVVKQIQQIVKANYFNQSSNIFIKTSTGYYAGYGAELKDIRAIKSVSGDLQIKASGGISNLKKCKEMIEAGATRIGTSKAFLIYNESK
tara:strand:- start:28 stop:750 length:723 start_codon:yes stop_codon:yes gene_type:complete